MQKEVADIKETQSSIISSQRHPSNQVLGLQNRHTKFHTRLQHAPLEIIVQIFAWIHVRTVLRYRRLSTKINQCLLTGDFARLNVQTADFQEELDGEFPALPDLYLLQSLYIDGNRFTGPIPTVFGDVGNMLYLTASRNRFSVIPATISELENLEELNISNNSFACEIPPEIWTLTELYQLDMSNCELSGSLAGVGNLRQLIHLDASNNQFSGELPSCEIYDLLDLGGLHLIGNQFSGGELLYSAESNLQLMCVDPEFRPETWPKDCLCRRQHEAIGDSQESDTET
ncbi:hypothetical protein CcCBS67573_g10480 [Chytriomyces confervae]|uniref:F-box domain-containing protein n=1 Tax=Chytriomyces confervae TaxID=246404 RepID=A0A507CUX2_9FUNG|nr:hypothetical protein CcCBS67573_g10480 [Chytriomyces confervae]